MNENEVQYHLAAVQGSLSLIQNYLAAPSKVNVDCLDEVSNFGTRVYPMGSLLIALVLGLSFRPSVGPSLNISKTAH